MKLKFLKKPSTERQEGVTLIEALVALLLFTVGALGLVALQFSSVAMSGDSQQRSLAIWKSQEFIDRIRSNAGQEAKYIAEIGNSTTDDLGDDTATKAFTCPATPGKNCNTGTCSSDEIVKYDVWEVFCEANTGVTGASVGGGSSGLQQLEIILFRNDEDVDGDGSVDAGMGDMELYLEWVSLEADANAGIANNNVDGSVGIAKTVKTSLCDNTLVLDSSGTVTSDTRIDMDSRLDAYCVRFR